MFEFQTPIVKNKHAYGATAFHCAVFAQDIPLIHRLVRLGYDINAVDSTGETAIYNAARRAGAEPHYFYVLRALCKEGADVNVTSHRAPLVRAASKKNPEVVQALINAGANVNSDGKPPALFATIEPARYHYVYAHTTAATLKILCNAGADIKRVNDGNHSVL